MVVEQKRGYKLSQGLEARGNLFPRTSNRNLNLNYPTNIKVGENSERSGLFYKANLESKSLLVLNK